MVSTIRPPYFCVPLLNEDRLPRDRPRLSAAAPYGIAVCLTQSIQGHHHPLSFPGLPVIVTLFVCMWIV